jgi:alpha-galactosidase
MNIPRVGPLPLACAATLNASISVQRLSVEAAIRGDASLLKQALLHDPLTAAVCDPDEIWQMADRMLVAQAKWLPQYRKEIPLAKARLRGQKDLGRHRGRGAARLKTLNLAQMKRRASASKRNAQAADKAGMTKDS